MSRAVALGYALAVTGAALTSLKGVVAKLAYVGDVGAVVVLAGRAVAALPFVALLGLVAWRRRRARGEVLPGPRDLVVTAGIGAACYWLSAVMDFVALGMISAYLERLLMYTQPAMVAVVGALFMGIRISLPAAASIVVGYAGIAVSLSDSDAAVTSGDWSTLAVGSALVVIASAIAGTYNLFARPLILTYGARLTTAVAISAACVAVLIHATLSGDAVSLASAVDGRMAVLMVTLALCSIVLPPLCAAASMHHISAQAVAAVGMLGPPVTAITGAIFLGEVLTNADLVGLVLVVVGVESYAVVGR